MVPWSLAVVLLAAVVGMGVAVLVWLHRDRPGAGPLAAFVVAASLWAVAHGLELAVPDVVLMERLLQTQLTLSVVVPVAWLVTVVEYTGHPYWLTRKRVALLLVEPAVFVTLVWSNGAHRLVFRSLGVAAAAGTSTLVPVWGLARWGHLAYMLVLILAGGVLLIRTMLRTNDRFQGQVLALLVAITVPTVGHAIHAFDLVPARFDPTSLGYVVSGVVLSGALLRGQLLDVAPVTRDLGREAVFAEMDDAVIIVDGAGRIVDVNAAATVFFSAPPDALSGRALADELPDLAATVPDAGERAQTDTRLERDGAVRYYDVRITPLYRSYGVVSGHLVSLRDVTDRRQREQRIDVLNRLLRHDIRNEMNVVRGNADLLADSVDPAQRDRIDRIVRTVDDIVDRSNKIGRVSEALESERARPLRLPELLAAVVTEARERHPVADIALSCPEVCWVEGSPALTLAFEELLDNAVEHSSTGNQNAKRSDDAVEHSSTGPASQARQDAVEHGDPPVTVDIEVTVRDDGVVVRVSDDGPGIAAHERAVILAGEETPLQHGSGVGLWLVKWVVRNVGGTLSFADGPGTTVEIELPAARPPATAERHSDGLQTDDSPMTDPKTDDSSTDDSPTDDPPAA
ncbi:histidine kinase N-terminal 7TM domain-containing protein [Haloarcula onubensis]|uniref:histidine kinase n=1 Tax=Haloarcula onubensis TaxID=2950539 RepID=A0ABU2FRN0_9EURY|nr:histidine kinase N-terminal 7TM domain-containing protein [Halomicroarcula sp. S3CR25-11]MDS0283422.1 ATP-binding protein [Halomicroarcula sp. S3CR25-11]